MTIFSGEPRLASFIAIRTMEVVVLTGAIRSAGLQSNRDCLFAWGLTTLSAQTGYIAP